MRDVFKEQLVKRLPNTKDTLMKAGLVVIVILVSLVVLVFIPNFFPLALAILGVGAYYAMGMLDIEYEYVLTNGDLDIDCIYSKRRRKRMFSCDLKNVEMMVHTSNKGYESIFSTAEDKKDYSSGRETDNTYMFIVMFKGKKTKITFEPDEGMLNDMFPFLGQRKLVKKV